MEKPAEKKADSENNVSQEPSLSQKIKVCVADLYYISESDAEIFPFDGQQAESVTKEEVLSQTQSSVDSIVEEKEFADFFTPLTEIQDWFGDEEKATAQKFVQLKELLERNLRDLKVFKVGKIQLDVYVVGLDIENKMLGIKTKAVET